MNWIHLEWPIDGKDCRQIRLQAWNNRVDTCIQKWSQASKFVTEPRKKNSCHTDRRKHSIDMAHGRHTWEKKMGSIAIIRIKIRIRIISIRIKRVTTCYICYATLNLYPALVCFCPAPALNCYLLLWSFIYFCFSLHWMLLSRTPSPSPSSYSLTFITSN